MDWCGRVTARLPEGVPETNADPVSFFGGRRLGRRSGLKLVDLD